MSPSRAGRLLLSLCFLHLTSRASSSNLWFENLPDGIHDVLIGPNGGIYLTGFDSRRRVCLVLFAPPFGRPLRTIAELPYRDYGMATPAVLTAHDPLHAEQIYVLLYLHPDNLGLEQTSLFRVELATGKLKLLSASTSPFWTPRAVVARRDGSVLVSLNGLGPMLVYSDCNDDRCSAAAEVHSNASSASGKGGMDELGGMLCFVVGSELVFGEGGHLVCELPDGSLESITSTSTDAGADDDSEHGADEDDLDEEEHAEERAGAFIGAGRDGGNSSSIGSSGEHGGGRRRISSSSSGSSSGSSAGATSDVVARHLGPPNPPPRSGNTSSSHDASSGPTAAQMAVKTVGIDNPSVVVASPPSGMLDDAHSGRQALYVVSLESVNEYGYAQGDVHTLSRREPREGEVCGRSGCWSEPRLVVRSVSNPAGLAVNAATDTLFVVEQNTLHGFSYETFEGDVLAFCARGHYDCSAAQNSGECGCERGFGGPCCDMPLSGLGPLFDQVLADAGPLSVVLLGISLIFITIRRAGVSRPNRSGREHSPPRSPSRLGSSGSFGSPSREDSSDASTPLRTHTPSKFLDEDADDVDNVEERLDDEREGPARHDGRRDAYYAPHLIGNGSGRAPPALPSLYDQAPMWLDDLAQPLMDARYNSAAAEQVGGCGGAAGGGSSGGGGMVGAPMYLPPVVGQIDSGPSSRTASSVSSPRSTPRSGASCNASPRGSSPRRYYDDDDSAGGGALGGALGGGGSAGTRSPRRTSTPVNSMELDSDSANDRSAAFAPAASAALPVLALRPFELFSARSSDPLMGLTTAEEFNPSPRPIAAQYASDVFDGDGLRQIPMRRDSNEDESFLAHSPDAEGEWEEDEEFLSKTPVENLPDTFDFSSQELPAVSLRAGTRDSRRPSLQRGFAVNPMAPDPPSEPQ